MPIPDQLKDVIQAKAEETQLQRRSSVLNAAGIQGLVQSNGGGMGGGGSSKDHRELKLQLARKEKELKEMAAQLEQLKKNGTAQNGQYDDIQNERDQLIMKNEALSELLAKNNITQPSDIKQAPSTGGKRTQTLIDEYKMKATKAKEESEKKTAELLLKSKKITEL